MTRKKFFLDPKIVMDKSRNMMKKQISLFENYYGSFQHHHGRFYQTLESGNMLAVEYYEDAGFMAKNFCTKVTLFMDNICMEKLWNASLSFRGTTCIEDLVWVAGKREYRSIVNTVNGNTALNSALLETSRKLDLVSINLKYSYDNQRLTVEILPYAGTYVWVKLPPAHCEVILKPDEIKALTEIIGAFEKYFMV